MRASSDLSKMQIWRELEAPTNNPFDFVLADESGMVSGSSKWSVISLKIYCISFKILSSPKLLKWRILSLIESILPVFAVSSLKRSTMYPIAFLFIYKQESKLIMNFVWSLFSSIGR